MKFRPIIPRHVAACQHSLTAFERWYIWVWNKADPSIKTRIPYSCNSWRCAVCARHEAAVSFARIKAAMGGKKPDGWCYLVLTIDREGYFGGRRWLDVNEAYGQISHMTRATLSRIGRLWGAEWGTERRQLASGEWVERPVRKLGNAWVAVVEAHQSGWPHVNLAVWCPELAALLRAEQADRLADPEIADALALARDAWARKESVPHHVRQKARLASLAGGAVRDLLVASGWGPQSTAEAARDLDAVAGYVVKLAGYHDASVGELAKVTQAPTNAPVRFRRIRSGKGFLPPREKDEETTGVLLRRKRSGEGDWAIVGVNAPKDEGLAEHVQEAIKAEYALIDEEERILARSRGRLAPMPPLRIAVHGVLQSHTDTSEYNAAVERKALDLCG